MHIFTTIFADLVNPNDSQGRTYRQINAELCHKIPIGTLVELETGARLFVVAHTRDCDQAPLYCLSADVDDTQLRCKGFANPGWTGGYFESSLTVIRPADSAGVI